MYPRDLVGYGPNPPAAEWPGDARVAVQFVVNYEEGGENCILHGDQASEAFLSDIIGAAALPGARHINMESLYDYGARAGVWRLMRIFGERGLNFTCFAVGMALERNPEVGRAMVAAGHEVASHGWRWIDYQYACEDVERMHIEKAVRVIEQITGQRPLGMYQGRCSPHTKRLTIEEGGFLYSADAYDDDLPHWDYAEGAPLLMVPYTLEANDMRFATPNGFNSGEQFFTYLKDAFDVLYAEGGRMMSVGLHCRLAGRPARAAAVARFLDYIKGHEKVWVARRVDIARHWIARYPAKAAK